MCTIYIEEKLTVNSKEDCRTNENVPITSYEVYWYGNFLSATALFTFVLMMYPASARIFSSPVPAFLSWALKIQKGKRL